MSSTEYTLSPVKNYESWDCSIVKTAEGKTAGFVFKSDHHDGMFCAIYQPRGRVPGRSMLQIAERKSKEECAEIIMKTYVNRYSRFLFI